MATPPADKEVTFTGIFVHRKNHAVVSAIVDEFADDNRDHAMVFRRIDGQWKHRLVDNSIAGACMIDEPTTKMVIAGIDGDVLVATLPGTVAEQVDPSPDGPNRSSFLRCITAIGNRVYVVGMARQVYRRDGPNSWTRIDQGTFVPRNQRTQSVGFNDIDGLTANALYAVGYKGEIWFYDGAVWSQLDSPTNVSLNCVQCAADDRVYAAGMAGTILRGNRNGWTAIVQDVTTKDFWGIASFREQVYLSNYDGVFILRGDVPIPVDMGLKKRLSTAYLDAGDGILWSVGHKDIACTEDGTTWVELDKP